MKKYSKIKEKKHETFFNVFHLFLLVILVEHHLIYYFLLNIACIFKLYSVSIHFKINNNNETKQLKRGKMFAWFNNHLYHLMAILKNSFLIYSDLVLESFACQQQFSQKRKARSVIYFHLFVCKQIYKYTVYCNSPFLCQDKIKTRMRSWSKCRPAFHWRSELFSLTEHLCHLIHSSWTT